MHFDIHDDNDYDADDGNDGDDDDDDEGLGLSSSPRFYSPLSSSSSAAWRSVLIVGWLLHCNNLLWFDHNDDDKDVKHVN